MNSRFIDACLAEIDEAVRWYSEQSPELPERFLAELQWAVEKLNPFPEAFHMVSPPYRRVRLSKFPYALFFRVDPAEIVIVGFFHQHADPAKWRELLKVRCPAFRPIAKILCRNVSIQEFEQEEAEATEK